MVLLGMLLAMRSLMALMIQAANLMEMVSNHKLFVITLKLIFCPVLLKRALDQYIKSNMTSKTSTRLKAVEQARQKLEDLTREGIVAFSFIMTDEGPELIGEEELTTKLFDLFEEQSIFEVAKRILEAEGFTSAFIHNSDVRHPVDGYNLIKRLGVVWPKVLDALKLLVTESWEGLEGADGRKVMRQLEKALERFPSWEENRVNFWLA